MHILWTYLRPQWRLAAVAEDLRSGEALSLLQKVRADEIKTQQSSIVQAEFPGGG